MESWDDDADFDIAGPLALPASHPARSSSPVPPSPAERHLSPTSRPTSRLSSSEQFDDECDAFDEDNGTEEGNSSTLKAKEGAALAQAAMALTASAGQVFHLGTRKTIAREGDWDEDLGLAPDAPLDLSQPTFRSKASFTSHISDDGFEDDAPTAKLSLPVAPTLLKTPERKGKSSAMSLRSQHSETEDDANMEVGFEDLPDKLVRKINPTRLVAHAVERPESQSNTSSPHRSSTSSLPVPTPSRDQPGTKKRAADSSATFSDIETDNDDSFFDDIVLPPAFGGPGLVTPPDSTGKDRSHKIDLQAIVAANLAARLEHNAQPNRRRFVEPVHEAFEDGLVIDDDLDWTSSPTARTFMRRPSSRGGRAIPTPPPPRTRMSSVQSSTSSGDGPRRSIESARAPERAGRFASRLSSIAIEQAQRATPGSSKSSPTSAPSSTKRSTASPPVSASSTSRSLARRASVNVLSHVSSSPSSTEFPSYRTGGYAQPTASSRARQTSVPTSTSLRDLTQSPTIPPARPSTPAGRGAALRLTMPTLSSRAKARTAISHISAAADPTGQASASLGVRASSAQTATKALESVHRPKRAPYGDGTELDGFDDLPINTEKERRYSVPRGPPPSRSASLNSARTARPTPASRRRPRTSEERSGHAARPRTGPHLIRNLGNAGAPRVEGNMTWNPTAMRWEGNEEAMRAFDSVVTASARPALITAHSLGPQRRGLTPGLGGVRIVGDMIFDPKRMAWFNRMGDPECELDLGEGEPIPDRTWRDPREIARMKPKPSFLNGPAAIGAKPGDGAEAFWKTCIDAERRHAAEMEPWTGLKMGGKPDKADRDHLWEIKRIVMNSRAEAQR